jgi:hypothetical protein
VPQQLAPPEQATRSAECKAICARYRPMRLSWAKLLQRVFEIDLEHCPNGGGSRSLRRSWKCR